MARTPTNESSQVPYKVVIEAHSKPHAADLLKQYITTAYLREQLSYVLSPSGPPRMPYNFNSFVSTGNASSMDSFEWMIVRTDGCLGEFIELQ